MKFIHSVVFWIFTPPSLPSASAGLFDPTSVLFGALGFTFDSCSASFFSPLDRRTLGSYLASAACFLLSALSFFICFFSSSVRPDSSGFSGLLFAYLEPLEGFFADYLAGVDFATFGSGFRGDFFASSSLGP